MNTRLRRTTDTSEAHTYPGIRLPNGSHLRTPVSPSSCACLLLCSAAVCTLVDGRETRTAKSENLWKSCRLRRRRAERIREKQRGFVDCRSLYLLVRRARPRNTDRRCCCAKPAGWIRAEGRPRTKWANGKWQRCWRPAHRRTEKSVYISFRNRAEFKLPASE